ncbi:hypothetical protein CAPTEDRAFT_222288 [Capitella teleta]|uniref:Sodium/potassium-transporting ATPase subunit beta-1-interacting protein n=1 Tax=Capitella teleta TaxID=283909 RepID=R7TU32_CAPTE|nr:hypothetical protein CAPTEDRAFT_222288 [Capitella teleta]|eukprot:ELT97184.1 hypothetical protein CAPTEDRAFT_222288 [Capitella teleta]
MKEYCCHGNRLTLTLGVNVQQIATVERQVFDFLGYMWAPIIGNFLQIIFIIVGFFGALQYRPKIVIVYAVWSLLWIGWNIFVICFYFEVGLLKRDSPILNIDTGNRSWWFDNGIGCQTPNKTQLDTGLDYVEGCLLQYYYVEIIHAAIQCLFSLLGFCVGCYVVYVFSEEDDSFDFIGGFDTFSSAFQSPAKSSHVQLQPVYVATGAR